MICMDTNDSATFHIYYRMQGTTGLPAPRDHIIKDGEALCNYGVSVPETEHLKPISEVSNAEWAVHFSKYSNLCGECSKSVEYYDLIPDDLPKETPEFLCPICEETAYSVDFVFDIASIHHKSDGSSLCSGYETHNIPRELYDVWRTNPEEPFSYSKLKEFIDNYPRVFRPKEYRKAKHEDWLQNKD